MDEHEVVEAIRAKTGSADANGCLPWLGRLDVNGYRTLRKSVNKKMQQTNVRRFLWGFNHPDEPLDKFHKCKVICENNKCVKVEHLRRMPLKEEKSSAIIWARLEKRGVRLGNGCLVAEKAYEKVSLRGVMMGIHKASYMLHKSLVESPTEQDENGVPLVLRHLCNDSRCFEPTHLAYGTLRENNYDDKIANGTLPRGPKNHNASISEELARRIKDSKPTTRRGQAGHETAIERAKRFGVHILV
ncbi:hypothetical protein KFL_010720040 [Klebsormidium nitens]|uniref:Zinc-binding loop region of homing endonuclease domain-containing protein n=1 Tax=Klebsormidium nitens TaxID=105231 RepID=A0A1Y1IVA0_KLENI|nr:hypothetical protein KFL_010720040 [Klebsormidium nitens]|eukprot:GAQ92617.1 hypothetical protein KFL_010720040 [Klebsormidium nitens]